LLFEGLPSNTSDLGCDLQNIVNKACKKWGETFADRQSWSLFAAGMVVYLITRFLYLEDYPIYFFTDEAAQQVRARELWLNGFRDDNGHWFPVTAQGPWFRFVSIAHYLQLPGWLLFGNTIYAVRGTSVLLGATAAWVLALILKRHFHCGIWWITPLIFGTMPSWFLHSRTAFECVYMAVFYAWFCYFYLNYTSGHTRSLLLAVVFGALTLYSYSAGPLIMLATGCLLLISDFKYHIKHARIVGVAFAFCCLLMSGLLFFFINYPDSPAQHAKMYSGVLSGNIPMTVKLQQVLHAYLGGLTPQFWFTWQPDNLRHQMLGLSHLLQITAPFFFLGIVLCFWRIKTRGSRLILIAITASGCGAALVFPEITRNMTFLIPACLLIVIGLDFLISRIRLPFVSRFLNYSLFSGITTYAAFLTYDALINGPTWYDDYTLFGQQWGSKQIIRDYIPEYLSKHPDQHVFLAIEWANSPDYILKFFNSPPNFMLDDIDRYLSNLIELPKGVFVVTASQMQRLRESKMLTYKEIEPPIYYPDGMPAFHVVTIQYSENALTVAEEFRLERNRLIEEKITTPTGEVWTVRHKAFDLGEVINLFNQDFNDLARGAGGYPFVVEVGFPNPKELRGIEVAFSQENTLTAILKNKEGAEIGHYYKALKINAPKFPRLRLDFTDLKEKVSSVRLELREEQRADSETVLMHIHEITFY